MLYRKRRASSDACASRARFPWKKLQVSFEVHARAWLDGAGADTNM